MNSRIVQTILRPPAFAARLLLFAICGLTGRCAAPAQSLDEELKRIPASQMAAAAREKGDAARGAVVFFQTHMACAKCHITGAAGQPTLGPDLTAIGGNQVTDEAIVESVLHPSKVIRAGYQSVTLVTAKGQSITALLVEQAGDRLVVRDVARGGETTVFQISELDSWKWNDLSIMPAGQVNQLNSRQQFLDLIRYLIEIRDGGPVRALQLQPPASLLTFTVPEYEKHIDHAGLIGDWNGESFQRGAAIYQRVCANCHGTVEKPGSLPSSLRFAEGKFKNGGDPLSMYRTLTHGFGLMAPQAWMVPSQKYDVIHYIRETYLRNRNPSQFIAVTAAYLRTLPAGSTRGPDPSPIVPWSAMDYGPSLTHTFEVPGPSHNLAYKGIAIRLDPGAGGVSRGRHWMLFDTDTLRVSAAWNAASILDAGAGTQSVAGSKSPRAEDNFIDWRGIQFNGEHNVHPRLAGETAYANSTGPGWANPSNGKFTDDRRVLGRDGRRYGPLPRDWGRFRGLHHHGQDVVLSYAIGTTEILEWPRLIVRDEPNASPLFGRTFNIGPRDRDLLLQVAEHSAEDAQLTELNADGSVVSFGPLRAAAANDKQNLTLAGNTYLAAGFSPSDLDAAWTSAQGRLQLRLPAGRQPLRFTLWLPAYSATASDADLRRIVVGSVDPPIPDADRDLTSLTRGGPPRWPQKLETQVIEGADDGPFAADFLTAPETNPWLAQTRFTGLDFFPDGRIAVCTWDGDVWLVETLETQNPPAKALTLRWQRIASGMFQPLGLKIVHEKIHVICRDQLTVLHDRNGDNEIDFYECLNNDHQVTEHFHEFAMGLQTDAEGNFYYAKSGCHGKKAVVPHHGTLLRVSKDGSHTDILANGFRAANGVCVNPDGSFVVTDQEGFWNPKNRINWVTLNPDGRPNFYGNMLGYHDVTDASDDAMVPPLCWITNAFDRSPAEPLWVTSDRWGPLKSSLLNLSYGYGKVFLVMLEKVGDRMQGGMVELPIPAFPTGVMRGRFHPTDGQLYLCGMFAWAGNATHPGGLYRLRVTGRSMNLPVQLHATRSGLNLTFTEPLDPTSIDVKNLQVKTWSLKRTANYGSKHYDEKMVPVKAAALSNDGRALRLDVVDLRPNWCMEIAYTLRSQDGAQVQGIIHNTIHRLSEGGP